MTTEELKDYLDKKLRLGKLDSALLFLSSSVGLIFAVTQSIEKSPASLALFAPAFFLGWVLPFYYGYVRGALVRDSIVDRYRGWIFFFSGLGMYFLVLVTGPLFETLAPVDPVTPMSTSLLLTVPSLLGFLFLTGFFFLKRFTRFIFGLVNEKPDDLTWEIARSTGAASAFMAMGGWFATRLRIFTVYSLVFLTPFALLVLYLWDKSDYYARGSIAGIEFKVVRKPGRLNGKRFLTFLKDTLIVATYAIFGTVAVLVIVLYDLTGFTLLLVETGFLVAVPMLILSYLTRMTRRLEFSAPPRKKEEKPCRRSFGDLSHSRALVLGLACRKSRKGRKSRLSEHYSPTRLAARPSQTS